MFGPQTLRPGGSEWHAVRAERHGCDPGLVNEPSCLLPGGQVPTGYAASVVPGSQDVRIGVERDTTPGPGLSRVSEGLFRRSKKAGDEMRQLLMREPFDPYARNPLTSLERSAIRAAEETRVDVRVLAFTRDQMCQRFQKRGARGRTVPTRRMRALKEGPRPRKCRVLPDRREGVGKARKPVRKPVPAAIAG